MYLNAKYMNPKFSSLLYPVEFGTSNVSCFNRLDFRLSIGTINKGIILHNFKMCECDKKYQKDA